MLGENIKGQDLTTCILLTPRLMKNKKNINSGVELTPFMSLLFPHTVESGSFFFFFFIGKTMSFIQ